MGLAICNEDRDSFVAELKATQKTIKMMAEPVSFTKSLTKFSIAKDLNKYNSDIRAADMGEASASEKAQNKSDLADFTEAVAAGLKEAKDGFAEASDLKKVL